MSSLSVMSDICVKYFPQFVPYFSIHLVYFSFPMHKHWIYMPSVWGQREVFMIWYGTNGVLMYYWE